MPSPESGQKTSRPQKNDKTEKANDKAESKYDTIFAMLKRRGFVWPAFEIYGGSAGFYDYGPLGTGLKNNIISLWRKYFVIGEGFAEIDSPNISPEAVFIASGHLAKFADFLVECKSCGAPFRADHLIKEQVPNAGTMKEEELDRELKRLLVKCPVCAGELSAPYPFNLMFRTNIGPGAKKTGYLRPETAQAMFMDFPMLYRYFREKLPFGAVQVGKGFRNEIAPRQGMIRLREFNMAEAEIFVDPRDKSHPKFYTVKDDKLHLLTKREEKLEITVGEAVAKGIIAHQFLGYYVALTRRLLLEAGIDDNKLRFRQHMADEMAHYAADCWDAEVDISFGWTEIVGIADRTCYDLSAHMKVSGADLTAFIRFDEPVEVEKEVVKANPARLGPVFKKDAGAAKQAIEALPVEDVRGRDKLTIEYDGKKAEIYKDMFSIQRIKEKRSGEKIIPHVIEPSYGLDRIIYSIMEHSYVEKKAVDEETGKEETTVVMSFPPVIAPIKVGVFPLMAKDGLDDAAHEINRTLREVGLNTYYDDSGSIGRRYARMDEAGTPFCITVDYDSIKPGPLKGTVTVRERDTTKQKRVPIEGLASRMSALVSGKAKFDVLAHNEAWVQ